MRVKIRAILRNEPSNDLFCQGKFFPVIAHVVWNILFPLVLIFWIRRTN